MKQVCVYGRSELTSTLCDDDDDDIDDIADIEALPPEFSIMGG
jgi:hypothetical protein